MDAVLAEPTFRDAPDAAIADAARRLWESSQTEDPPSPQPTPPTRRPMPTGRGATGPTFLAPQTAPARSFADWLAPVPETDFRVNSGPLAREYAARQTADQQAAGARLLGTQPVAGSTMVAPTLATELAKAAGRDVTGQITPLPAARPEVGQASRSKEAVQAQLSRFDTAIQSTTDPVEKRQLEVDRQNYQAQMERVGIQFDDLGQIAASEFTFGQLQRPVARDLEQATAQGLTVSPERLQAVDRLAGYGGLTGPTGPSTGDVARKMGGAMLGQLPFFVVGTGLEGMAARATAGALRESAPALATALETFANPEVTPGVRGAFFDAMRRAPAGLATAAVLAPIQAHYNDRPVGEEFAALASPEGLTTQLIMGFAGDLAHRAVAEAWQAGKGALARIVSKVGPDAAADALRATKGMPPEEAAAHLLEVDGTPREQQTPAQVAEETQSLIDVVEGSKPRSGPDVGFEPRPYSGPELPTAAEAAAAREPVARPEPGDLEDALSRRTPEPTDRLAEAAARAPTVPENIVRSRPLPEGLGAVEFENTTDPGAFARWAELPRTVRDFVGGAVARRVFDPILRNAGLEPTRPGLGTWSEEGRTSVADNALFGIPEHATDEQVHQVLRDLSFAAKQKSYFAVRLATGGDRVAAVIDFGRALPEAEYRPIVEKIGGAQRASLGRELFNGTTMVSPDRSRLVAALNPGETADVAGPQLAQYLTDLGIDAKVTTTPARVISGGLDASDLDARTRSRVGGADAGVALQSRANYETIGQHVQGILDASTSPDAASLAALTARLEAPLRGLGDLTLAKNLAIALAVTHDAQQQGDDGETLYVTPWLLGALALGRPVDLAFAKLGKGFVPSALVALKLMREGVRGKVEMRLSSERGDESKAAKVVMLTKKHLFRGDYEPQLQRVLERGWADVKAALQNPETSHGIEWYRRAVKAMGKIMAHGYPELAGASQRTIFHAIVAMTSPNSDPLLNLVQAERIYRQWRSGEGLVKSLKDVDLSRDQVPGNLPQLERDRKIRWLGEQIDRQGIDATAAMLMEKARYRVKADATPTPDGKHEAYRAVQEFMGRKTGRFFLNLQGIDTEFTTDIWATRTLRRWLGYQVLEPYVKVTDTGERVVVKGPDGKPSYKLSGLPSDREVDLAQDFARQIAARAKTELGLDLAPMDVQALLWYYEKHLYAKAGGDNGGMMDFAQAAQRVIGKLADEHGTILGDMPDGAYTTGIEYRLARKGLSNRGALGEQPGRKAADALEGRTRNERGILGTYGLTSRLEQAVTTAKLEKAPAATWMNKLKDQVGEDERDWVLAALLQQDPKKSWTKAELLAAVQDKGIRLEEEQWGYDARSRIEAEPLERAAKNAERRWVEARDLASDYSLRGTPSKPGLTRKIGIMALPSMLDRAHDGESALNLLAREHAELYPDSQLRSVVYAAGEKRKAYLAAQEQLGTVRGAGDPKWKSYATSRSTRAGDDLSLDNYREIIVRLKRAGDMPLEAPITKEDGGYEGQPPAPVYASSHWEGVDNPLLHLRLQDITHGNEHGLVLEELQSDWLQSLRETSPEDRVNSERLVQLGKARDNAEQAVWDYAKTFATEYHNNSGLERPEAIDTAQYHAALQTPEGQRLDGEYRRLKAEYTNLLDKVEEIPPDAPFKRTWETLGAKRLLDEAVAGGYDHILWPSGETQQNRYPGLVSKAKALAYTPELRRLEFNAESPMGRGARHGNVETGWGTYADPQTGKEEFTPEDLRRILGPEVATRLLEQKPNGPPSGVAGYQKHSLESGRTETFTLGGRGMTEHYDRVLPDILAKLVKKYGGSAKATLETREDLTPNFTGTLPRPSPPQRYWRLQIEPQVAERIKGGQELGALGAKMLAGKAAGGAIGALVGAQVGQTDEDRLRNSVIGLTAGLVLGPTGGVKALSLLFEGAKQRPGSVAMALVGGALTQASDETIRDTGYGMLGLAALSAIGTKELWGGARAKGDAFVAAMRKSEVGLALMRATNPEALLSPDAKLAIAEYERTVAQGRAMGAEYGAAATKLGPQADRFLSDVVERADPAAMPVAREAPPADPATLAQALGVAARYATESEALDKALVSANALAPEASQAHGEGRGYLPQMYAEFEALRVMGEPPKGSRPTGTPGTPQLAGRELGTTPEDLATRDALGEIREFGTRARARFERGFHRLASARLFTALRSLPDALHPEYLQHITDFQTAQAAYRAAPAGSPAQTEARLDMLTASQEISKLAAAHQTAQGNWIALPDTERWGVLRGAVVDRDVANSLKGLPELTSVGALTRRWKLLKTAYNLGTAVGNFMSNIQVTHMAGIPVWEQLGGKMGEAWRDFRTYGPASQALARAGVFQASEIAALAPDASTGLSRSELLKLRATTRPETEDVLIRRGILTHEERAAQMGAPPWAVALGKVLDVGGGRLQAYDERVRRWYQNGDNLFRVMLYRHALAQGHPDPVEFARAELVNFRTRSPALRLLASSTHPFILYPAKALPQLARQVVDHPWRWVTLMTAPALLDQLSQYSVGAVNQQDLEPGQQRRSLGYLLPGPTQLPWTDEEGNKAMFDVSRWSPLSALTTGGPPGTVFGKLWQDAPQVLQPSGPGIEATSILLNRDPFTGKERVKGFQTPSERRTQFAKDVMQLTTPSMIGYYGPKVARDLARGDQAAALNSAGGFVGLRPRYIQPGGREDSATFELRANVRAAKQDLKSELRKSKSPDYDEAIMQQYDQRVEALFRAYEQEWGKVPSDMLDEATVGAEAKP